MIVLLGAACGWNGTVFRDALAEFTGLQLGAMANFVGGRLRGLQLSRLAGWADGRSKR